MRERGGQLGLHQQIRMVIGVIERLNRQHVGLHITVEDATVISTGLPRVDSQGVNGYISYAEESGV